MRRPAKSRLVNVSIAIRAAGVGVRAVVKALCAVVEYGLDDEAEESESGDVSSGFHSFSRCCVWAEEFGSHLYEPLEPLLY